MTKKNGSPKAILTFSEDALIVMGEEEKTWSMPDFFVSIDEEKQVIEVVVPHGKSTPTQLKLADAAAVKQLSENGYLEALFGLENWENIFIEKNDASPYFSIDGIVYNAKRHSLVQCPKGKTGHVNVADGTVLIEKDAFLSTKISSVSLPDSLQKIASRAFAGSEIEKIDFGKGITKIGRWEADEENIFVGCKKLKHLDFPDQIEEIGKCAFMETSLESVTFGKGDFRIGDYAFSGCNIKQIILPENLHDIGYRALDSAIRIQADALSVPFYHFLQSCLVGDLDLLDEETSSYLLDLDINGRRAYIPKYVNIDWGSETFFDVAEAYFQDKKIYLENGKNVRKELNALFHECYGDVVYWTALELYQKDSTNLEVKNYLASHANIILRYFIQSGDEETAVLFVKLGFLSGEQLRRALALAQEANLSTLSAYLLQGTKNEKKETQFFL